MPRRASEWADLDASRLRECLRAGAYQDQDWGVAATQFQRWRQAAVLIAVHPGVDEPCVLMTRRADHLRHHAGQVSFPGGALESIDAGPQDAALREAREEVGLQVGPDQVLGRLPGFRTITGFHVTPFVAWLDAVPESLIINPGEVAEAFHLPISRAFSPEAFDVRRVRHLGETYTVHSMQWEGRTIWGATAAILVRLGERIQAIAATSR